MKKNQVVSGLTKNQLDKALLLHSQIVKLQAPSKGTLRAFRHWFKPGPRKTKLRGHSSRILDDDSDLLALRVPVDQDRLTWLIQEYFPWPFMVSHLIQRTTIPSIIQSPFAEPSQSNRNRLKLLMKG